MVNNNLQITPMTSIEADVKSCIPMTPIKTAKVYRASVLLEDYEKLSNIPFLNNIKISGNKTLHDYGIQEEISPLSLQEIGDIFNNVINNLSNTETENNESFIFNENDIEGELNNGNNANNEINEEGG